MKEFFRALKNKRVRREYLKSIAVGIVSTALDFLITAVILYLAGRSEYDGFIGVITGKLKPNSTYVLPVSIYLIATVLSFVISVLFNYIMCIKIAISLAIFVFNFFTRKYFVYNVALIRDDEHTISL